MFIYDCVKKSVTCHAVSTFLYVQNNTGTREDSYRMIIGSEVYPRRVRNTPAATADPITPATFGPIAGISGFTCPSV